jgi:ABC-type phosphate transport system substrate-binding protein
MKLTEVFRNFIIIASRSFPLRTYNVVRIFSQNIMRSSISSLSFAIMFSMISCNSGKTKEITETPTSGNIRIAVDESFQPLIDTEVYTFTSLYLRARVKPEYKPEFDVVNDFMNDSVKVMVTGRKLSDSQLKYLRDNLIIGRTITFAYDALALITNKENLDTLVTYNNVRDIFKGQVKNWKEIDAKSKLGKMSIIFDSNKSGNIRYFKELFEISDTLGSNFYAVNSNAEVIDFVSRNPEAIGIISVNWISDKDDSLSRSFVKKVNVLAVSQQFINDGSFYRPYPGSIYNRTYPFVREVYLISRETFTGLGSGFIQWATGEQGQRIVLKSGLVPATMPIRLVQIRKE